MKVEYTKKSAVQVPATKPAKDVPANAIEPKPGVPAKSAYDPTFEAILDAYAKNPERWDGLE